MSYVAQMEHHPEFYHKLMQKRSQYLLPPWFIESVIAVKISQVGSEHHLLLSLNYERFHEYNIDATVNRGKIINHIIFTDAISPMMIFDKTFGQDQNIQQHKISHRSVCIVMYR